MLQLPAFGMPSTLATRVPVLHLGHSRVTTGLGRRHLERTAHLVMHGRVSISKSLLHCRQDSS